MMKDIVFYNLENIEILSLSQFDFKYINDDPYIIEYTVKYQDNAFHINKKEGGRLADFKGLIYDLQKMLEKNKKKFYFYPSVDDLFYIIFDLKDNELIEVSITIKNSMYLNDFSCQYEMERLQILNLKEQVYDLVKNAELFL